MYFKVWMSMKAQQEEFKKLICIGVFALFYLFPLPAFAGGDWPVSVWYSSFILAGVLQCGVVYWYCKNRGKKQKNTIRYVVLLFVLSLLFNFSFPLLLEITEKLPWYWGQYPKTYLTIVSLIYYLVYVLTALYFFPNSRSESVKIASVALIAGVFTGVLGWIKLALNLILLAGFTIMFIMSMIGY